MRYRPALLASGSGLLAALLPHPARAQAPPPGNYGYATYTVLDRTTPGPDSLTAVPNVGGNLRLNADGTYHKSLSIVFPAGPRYFAQTGRVSFPAPDSIAFAFTDLKGPDVQRGTYRYEPATGRLSIRLAGYPPGNEGRYELFAIQEGKPLPQYTEAPDEAKPSCAEYFSEQGMKMQHQMEIQRRRKKPLKPTKPRPRR